MTEKKTKFVFLVWDTYERMLKKAAKNAGVDIFIMSHHVAETESNAMERLDKEIRSSDIVLYYKSNQQFWSEADSVMRVYPDKKVITVGSDPSYWSDTNVDHDVAITSYKYLLGNGQNNCDRLLQYLNHNLMGRGDPAQPPEEIPWQGIIHPNAPGRIFNTPEEYLDWYNGNPCKPWVGIISTRSAYVSNECKGIDYPVLHDIEDIGCNVIMFFSMSTRDEADGKLNISDSIRRYFVDKNGKSRVSAILKLSSFITGFSKSGNDKNEAAISGSRLLEILNVPVFQPVIATHMSVEGWRSSSGLAGDIAWMIAFPEFEGVIEPMMLGATRPTDESEYERTVIPESSRLLAERIFNRIHLGRKPASERKVVFFLNNNPCASVEANVGGASHLDTHESMANILKRMSAEGYTVNPPKNGKDLISNIMEHKAISEFRWTSVQEIDKHGGVIYRMSVDEYNRYFMTLPSQLRDKIVETWGEPPGKSMVLNDEILITGVSYGNAIVAVQPKRGCFGARCDGEVCKILHDPLCPPTHQYLASYFYYEELWGADAVVHVGTHGNLEFLPGKTAGVGANCYPMIGIGKVPHFYIYNSDNPPEGTIAKRRSMATLVDHMQCVMVGSSLYDNFTELDNLLSEYENARQDKSHAHQLQHLILEAANKANLGELGLTCDMPLDQCVRLCHEALSKIRNSQMNLGMHVIGTVPQGDARVEFINSILRYDTGSGSIRDLVAELMDVNLSAMYEDQGGYNSDMGISNGAVIELLGNKTRDLIGELLRNGGDVDKAIAALCLDADDHQLRRLVEYSDKIVDISKRIDDSHEIEALLNGFSGGFVPPGPSGLITRGRPDILPTGRNFYSLDPTRLPTKSAWNVGVILADGIIKKYEDDAEEIPENIAFFWMCNDLLTADGEEMAQMMSLMGIRPVWGSNGQVKDYEIIPLNEMTHPRIDLTVRTSGILRDNFMNCVDILDRAVRELSELNEPPDLNYIRRHTLRALGDGVDLDEATARFFCAPPGSYVSGVNLAVFASSWKTEKDLSDIYVASNGYAYGGGRNGKPMHGQFAVDLSTVDVTYNKVASDEHDLLGCCCYFSNQGGMTAASRQLSGKDVKAYYGDTREPKDINVHTLADEIRRTVRTKLFNPRWIEGEMQHGYKGCTDIMKRITRVYGWEASTQEVDDWIFDDITSTFVNDPKMKDFFKENNPYALEEIARRMLEANQRGLWNAKDDVLEELKENYVEIESWMEDIAGDGEYQGGNIDIITSGEVDSWGANMSDIAEKVKKRMQHNKN